MALVRVGELNYETCGWDYWWEYLEFPTLTDAVTGRVYAASVTLANNPKESPDIQWRMANGYKKSRLKEDDRPDILIVNYNLIDQLAKEELETFEEDYAKIGESPFSWTDPSSIVSGNYKLLGTIECTLNDGEGSLWNTSMQFEEVI